MQDQETAHRKAREAEVHSRMLAHRGYVMHRELMAFETILNNVCRGNLDHIVRHLQASRQPDLAMELVQNVRPPIVREQYLGELGRTLHNYVASVASVVDHSRALCGHVAPEVVQEWNIRRVELWSANPVLGFVKDLRNFMLHEQIPFFGTQVSMTNANKPNATFERVLSVSRSALLGWDGWKSDARSFITSLAEDSIDLEEFVTRHAGIFLPLNYDLFNLLAKINAPLLVEVNGLRVEMNAARFGVSVEEMRASMARERAGFS